MGEKNKKIKIMAYAGSNVARFEFYSLPTVYERTPYPSTETLFLFLLFHHSPPSPLPLSPCPCPSTSTSSFLSPHQYFHLRRKASHTDLQTLALQSAPGKVVSSAFGRLIALAYSTKFGRAVALSSRRTLEFSVCAFLFLSLRHPKRYSTLRSS